MTLRRSGCRRAFIRSIGPFFAIFFTYMGVCVSYDRSGAEFLKRVGALFRARPHMIYRSETDYTVPQRAYSCIHIFRASQCMYVHIYTTNVQTSRAHKRTCHLAGANVAATVTVAARPRFCKSSIFSPLVIFETSGGPLAFYLQVTCIYSRHTTNPRGSNAKRMNSC